MTDIDDQFGLLTHMDRTGTPCIYCEKPSVSTLIVGPNATLFDTRVGLCEDHQREPEKPVGNWRAKRDRAAERNQMTMDVGDV